MPMEAKGTRGERHSAGAAADRPSQGGGGGGRKGGLAGSARPASVSDQRHRNRLSEIARVSRQTGASAQPTGNTGVSPAGQATAERRGAIQQDTGLGRAVAGLVNPQPTTITGNPIFDAVVSMVPVIGQMMNITGFLQDLGVPSAPASTGAGYQAGQARQLGGFGQQGPGFGAAPNPLLSALMNRRVTPQPVRPPSPINVPPVVDVTTRGARGRL